MTRTCGLARTSVHRDRAAMLLVLAVWLAAPQSAEARVWRVQRDGTGDYTTIQPAINAASPGDTILIGRGRYTEHAPFTVGVVTVDTYVAVTVDSLTLLGEDREETVIGPLVRQFEFDTAGIATSSQINRLAISNVKLMNLLMGVGTLANTKMWECVTDSCRNGLASFADGRVDVRNCVFLHSFGFGVTSGAPTEAIDVRQCEFDNTGIIASGAVAFVSTPEANVTDCVIRNSYGGVQYQGSVGTVRDCQLIGCYVPAIIATGGGRIRLEGNRVHSVQRGVHVADSYSRIEGTGNVFHAEEWASITLSNGWASLHGNHILRGSGRFVELAGPTDVGQVVDLRNNYWGVTDADSIAAHIWDRRDDPTLYAEVQYIPFATSPLPEQKQTIGGVKQMFRGRR